MASQLGTPPDGAAAPAADSGITLGVEIEFLVPHATQGAAQPTGIFFGQHAPTRRAVATQIYALTRGSVPLAALCDTDGEIACGCAVCSDALPSQRYHGMRIFTNGTPQQEQAGEAPAAPPGANPHYYYFMVQNELLVPTRPPSRWQGIEISSPIFTAGEVQRGLPQLAVVVAAIENMPMEVSVTRACGLHLHAGLSAGLDLDTVKRVVTLAMLLERPLLKNILSPLRLQSISAQPIGIFSRFARDGVVRPPGQPAAGPEPVMANMERHLPWTAYDMPPASYGGGFAGAGSGGSRATEATLRLVWQADSLYRLRKGLETGGGLRCGLALRLRDSYGDSWAAEHGSFADPRHSTIEFRYPQMRLDATYIQCWAELCSAIMRVSSVGATSYRATLALFATVMADARGDATREWQGSLNVLGLHHQVPFWRAMIEGYRVEAARGPWPL